MTVDRGWMDGWMNVRGESVAVLVYVLLSRIYSKDTILSPLLLYQQDETIQLIDPLE